jgi:tetratricopeptide (TPR) repeat protein
MHPRLPPREVRRQQDRSLMKHELDTALKCLRDEGDEKSAPLFSSLLATYPEQRDNVYRKRSLVLAELDLFDEAVRDRQAIIDGGHHTAGDLYFAGEYALQAGAFDVARNYFDLAIQRAARSGDPYYLGSSRLLAALASYQLNEDERCRTYLEEVDDEVEVLWLRGFDRVTKQLMIQVLSRGTPSQ